MGSKAAEPGNNLRGNISIGSGGSGSCVCNCNKLAEYSYVRLIDGIGDAVERSCPHEWSSTQPAV